MKGTDGNISWFFLLDVINIVGPTGGVLLVLLVFKESTQNIDLFATKCNFFSFLFFNA